MHLESDIFENNLHLRRNIYGMGGSVTKREQEKDTIKGDQHKDVNSGLFQITVEHMSGSFVTLILICLVAVVYLAIKWRRRRKGNNSEVFTKTQLNRAIESHTARLDRRDHKNDKKNQETAIDMSDLPRVFLVANSEHKSFEAETSNWSPSQTRLGKK